MNGDPRLRLLERKIAAMRCMDDAFAHMAAEEKMKDFVRKRLEAGNTEAATAGLALGLSHRALSEEYLKRVAYHATGVEVAFESRSEA